MIEFAPTEQQEAIRAFVRAFAEQEIRPIAAEADRRGEVPMDFLRKVKAMGFSMEAIPKEVGGEGEGAGEIPDQRGHRQTNRLAVIVAEELAWGDPAVILTLPGPGLGGPPVRFIGTPEQKERFFSIFNDPEPRWGAYAMTEPEAGSDVAAIRTTARREGDHYVLNGTKTFITNGARASWNVVFATVDRSLGRAGHRAFVVEQGTPGFRVGRIMKKMGLRASETAELVLENCRVPAENLLGGEEHYRRQGKEGFKVAMQTFDSTRPLVAAMGIGIARAAYEYALEYARQNLLGGPSPVRRRNLEDRLVAMGRKLEAARLLVWEAAWMADAGIPNSKEASMAKAYAGKACTEVCIDAVQVMGAAGASREHPVEKCFRDIKVYDIFEGTGQINRLIIARRIFEPLGVRV